MRPWDRSEEEEGEKGRVPVRAAWWCRYINNLSGFSHLLWHHSFLFNIMTQPPRCNRPRWIAVSSPGTACPPRLLQIRAATSERERDTCCLHRTLTPSRHWICLLYKTISSFFVFFLRPPGGTRESVRGGPVVFSHQFILEDPGKPGSASESSPKTDLQGASWLRRSKGAELPHLSMKLTLAAEKKKTHCRWLYLRSVFFRVTTHSSLGTLG